MSAKLEIILLKTVLFCMNTDKNYYNLASKGYYAQQPLQYFAIYLISIEAC